MYTTEQTVDDMLAHDCIHRDKWLNQQRSTEDAALDDPDERRAPHGKI